MKKVKVKSHNNSKLVGSISVSNECVIYIYI